MNKKNKVEKINQFNLCGEDKVEEKEALQHCPN